MTTQTTQELDELVAQKLGWNVNIHIQPQFAPSDPRELFDLMVRYEIGQIEFTTYIGGPFEGANGYVECGGVIEFYTDHASKLEAATRVILRGVLSRIKGEKK